MKNIYSPAILFILLSTSNLRAQDYIWAKAIGSDWASAENIQANGMAVDNAGSAVVVGDFQGTADFDPGSGTANLTDAGLGDLFFAKYDASGNYVWANRIGSADDVSVAFSVSLDTSDNIYLAGYFGDTLDFDPGAGVHLLTCPATFQNQDAFIAKYNSNGDFVWAKNIGGPDIDRIYNTVLDNNGNIYVAGYFHYTADFDPGAGVANLTAVVNNPTQSNLFFAKYDNNGNYLWAKPIASTSEYIDIAIDGSSNIYLTGNFADTVDFDPGSGIANLIGNPFMNMFFAKYDANGNYVYAKSVANASNVTHYAHPGRAMRVDNSGNLYLSGTFSSFTGTDFDPGLGTATLTTVGSSNFYLAKYDVNGNYVWAKQLNGDSEASGLIFDNNGNLVATGIYHSVVDFDFGSGVANLPLYPNQTFLARYDTNGNYLAAKSFGGSQYDYVTGMGIDGNGNLFCTGMFLHDSTDFDPGAAVVVLNKTITSVWQNVFVAKYHLGPISSVKAGEMENISAKIYPNPNNGSFMIEFTDDATKEVEITDAVGRVILSPFEVEKQKQISLNEIAAGIYFLNIRQNGELRSLKFSLIK